MATPTLRDLAHFETLVTHVVEQVRLDTQEDVYVDTFNENGDLEKITVRELFVRCAYILAKCNPGDYSTYAKFMVGAIDAKGNVE